MRAFGADRIDAGTGETIVLISALPKSWQPRAARTLTTPEYPGTAVEWDGRLFEILEADPTPSGGVRYRLGPWPDGHAIRRLERYDEVSESIRQTDRRDHSLDRGKRRLSVLLAPLAGLLPGEIQKKMERDFGAPAIAMTVASAVPLFLVGFLGLFNFMLHGAGGVLDFPEWLAPSFPVAAYLFGESALRLASAIAGGEPMGTLWAALALAVWRAARQPKAETEAMNVDVPAAAAADDPGERLRDRFHILEPVLALLSPGEQELLAGRYGFDSVGRGRLTAVVLLVACVLNTFVSLSAFGTRGGAFSELLWFFPVACLAAEQVLRLKTLSRGEPAGSVLAVLVRPVAKPLLAPGG
jgi:hypothetical protein